MHGQNHIKEFRVCNKIQHDLPDIKMQSVYANNIMQCCRLFCHFIDLEVSSSINSGT